MLKNLRTPPTTIINQKIGKDLKERLKCNYKLACVFSQKNEIPEMLARIGKLGLLMV